MVHHGQHLEAVVVQAEQHADAGVVDAALHGAVDGAEVPVVVALGAGQVHLLVGGAVVGLLEELVGADVAGLEPAVVLDVEGGDVHVEAPDLAVARLHAVDGLDGVVDVVEAAAVGIALTRHQEDALVALVDDDLGLAGDLLEGQVPAQQALVAGAERTVTALVLALVGDVHGGEQHQPVAVDGLLDVAGGGEDLLVQVRVGVGQQHGHVLVVEALRAREPWSGRRGPRPGSRRHDGRGPPRSVRRRCGARAVAACSRGSLPGAGGEGGGAKKLTRLDPGQESMLKK